MSMYSKPHKKAKTFAAASYMVLHTVAGRIIVCSHNGDCRNLNSTNDYADELAIICYKRCGGGCT
ncbi:MAG: hypothetical protein A2314_00805 [Elusimicrobia bacterium RIFOXYB2_FULL_50_12]|nr:MAG: hypothetical protein A2314_00805 [Elusimicrobia bacterium RIFOXYB2_FULL_50_12]